MEAASRKRKLALKSLETSNKRPATKTSINSLSIMDSVNEPLIEDADDGPIDDHLQVEMSWGDEISIKQETFDHAER